jgi:hypothetical protein
LSCYFIEFEVNTLKIRNKCRVRMRKPMDVKRYFPGGLIAEWRAQVGEAPGGVWRVLLDLGGRPIRSGDGKRAREAAKKCEITGKTARRGGGFTANVRCPVSPPLSG